ncbi:aldehyde dehydrogenase [Histidinibacterium aquaticum]|uniref:aldehyde dehydrogenase n=1 Tax=Histidinibacterium aquaticum TaxID=2613962 RepID=UPI00168B448C|nr:aldehyde dehydrogenase [Histidinibacterium aquaticum]
MTLKTIMAAALSAAMTLPAVAQEGEDPASDIGDVGALYPAEGAELTYDICTACHSEMIVAQQGQTREGWDELLQWMVEEQGMEPLFEDEREIVLDYLSTHYNTDRPHFPQ